MANFKLGITNFLIGMLLGVATGMFLIGIIVKYWIPISLSLMGLLILVLIIINISYKVKALIAKKKKV